MTIEELKNYLLRIKYNLDKAIEHKDRLDEKDYHFIKGELYIADEMIRKIDKEESSNYLHILVNKDNFEILNKYGFYFEKNINEYLDGIAEQLRAQESEIDQETNGKA